MVLRMRCVLCDSVVGCCVVCVLCFVMLLNSCCELDVSCLCCLSCCESVVIVCVPLCWFVVCFDYVGIILRCCCDCVDRLWCRCELVVTLIVVVD